MKKNLDFHVQGLCYLENSNFIQRFTAAYLYIESKENPEEIHYTPEVGGMCFGCNGGEGCPQDAMMKKRCGLFFLFNTMTGNSAIRRRFDGTPTAMQELMGDTAETGGGIGSEFVVDFLFGYTGYNYRKCDDPATFKKEIIASIDAGRPVIAKMKLGAEYTRTFGSDFKIENFRVNGEPVGLTLKSGECRYSKPGDIAKYAQRLVPDGVYVMDKTFTGDVTVEYDITPLRPANYSTINALAALTAPGLQINEYGDLAVILKMGDKQAVFNAYNEGGFVFPDTQVPAETGKRYSVTLKVTTGEPAVYDVWVQPEGGEKIQVAKDFKQRKTATALNEIGQVCLIANSMIEDEPQYPYKLITGYDGDALKVSHFMAHNSVLEEPPDYSEIDALYIFGEKCERRYTLADGLENIRRVMEYNIDEKLWDEYLTKLGGCEKYPSPDGLDKASPEERLSRAQNVSQTNMYMYNFCSFGGAFDVEPMTNHYLHKELFDPALTEVWSGFGSSWVIVDAGHVTGRLSWKPSRARIWQTDDVAKLAALSEEVCDAVLQAKEADMATLVTIKQAIEVVAMSPAQREDFLRNLNAQREAQRLERINRFQSLLDAAQSAPPRSAAVNVDLSQMETHGDFELRLAGGMPEMKMEGDKCRMVTPQQFTAPLKIELRAKTDSTNIRMNYAQGGVVLNWEVRPDELRIHDIATDRGYGFRKCGEIPTGEFVDIEWILAKDVMAVKVNGEIRHIGDEYDYIKEFKETPGFTLSSAVAIAAAWGSTVTAEHLCVTEL